MTHILFPSANAFKQAKHQDNKKKTEKKHLLLCITFHHMFSILISVFIWYSLCVEFSWCEHILID